MTFPNGRIVIPLLNSLSGKGRSSEVFAHSGFETALSFVIIGNISVTALRLIGNTRTLENWNFKLKFEF